MRINKRGACKDQVMEHKGRIELEKPSGSQISHRQGQSYAQFSFNARKSQPYKDQDYVVKGLILNLELKLKLNLRLNLNWLGRVQSF